MDDRPRLSARAPLCARHDPARLPAGAPLAPSARMTQARPPAYIELDLTDDADEPWLDEKTVRFDFDKPNLTAEDRLVIGYLTMEANGLFGHLSVEEQLAVASTLKR